MMSGGFQVVDCMTAHKLSAKEINQKLWVNQLE